MLDAPHAFCSAARCLSLVLRESNLVQEHLRCLNTGNHPPRLLFQGATCKGGRSFRESRAHKQSSTFSPNLPQPQLCRHRHPLRSFFRLSPLLCFLRLTSHRPPVLPEEQPARAIRLSLLDSSPSLKRLQRTGVILSATAH
ncbi:hypothetical protein BR93DRAFT_708253 [Coniochaeta sp. PMI_546]|nr:hypothetical protein BR93DRAFT_708253 [Coniochaeta sp. PMI_546]